MNAHLVIVSIYLSDFQYFLTKLLFEKRKIRKVPFIWKRYFNWLIGYLVPKITKMTSCVIFSLLCLHTCVYIIIACCTFVMTLVFHSVNWYPREQWINPQTSNRSKWKTWKRNHSYVKFVILISQGKATWVHTLQLCMKERNCLHVKYARKTFLERAI